MKTTVGELKQLIKEAVANSAEMDLRKYAAAWGLEVVEGEQEIADMIDVDVGDESVGMDVAAMWNDDHYHYVTVFVRRGGGLRRFGIEGLGEDPSQDFETTLDEMMQMGDPRKIEWV